MKRFVEGFRRFYTSLGLVEQSQVVASTAVIVAMGTILAAHFFTGEALQWLDFVSVITVGIIGFVSVYFSLKYGRQLEEQRRELQALNTIAEAVNHSVELNYVLQSALEKVVGLMEVDCGWIYIVEDEKLVLKRQYGTLTEFFLPSSSICTESPSWLREPKILSIHEASISKYVSKELFEQGIKMIASIPLERQNVLAGVLIIASKDVKAFERKKIALIQAFGNQINMALHNASLFEQLKHSERLYADLYEHSPDMYHSVDRHGIVVSCNLTESQVLGIPKEEIIGKPVFQLYPPSQQEDVRQHLKSIFELGKELKGVEEQMQKRDGSLVDVSVNTSTVYNNLGKPVLARMVLRDITEKKKMEEKILHAQKIDSVGNLAGGIAHNFNNILTSILGSASIMKRKVKEDARWLKYVDLIETASRRGAALTRQLLTFARKDNPHIKLVELNHLIDETIHLFEASAPKNIQINKTLSGEPLMVEADEGQLQQMLLNLFLNTRDAMPNGGMMSVCSRPVKIDEEQARHFTDGHTGDFVMISVADSGVGIPKSIRDRIFEPFFTTKERGKGTGLGLSVVYGIVRSHNGYINVESEVDVGSVFTIYLPRLTDTKLTVGKQKLHSELVGGNERILLVEDESSVSEIGTEILQDLGYSVRIARNGQEAIEYFRNDGPFHLVILDIDMPKLAGGPTFELIKKLCPEVKVLLCSGYSQPMIDDGKMIDKSDGFIQKPFEIEDFASTVRKALDQTVPLTFEQD